MTHPSGVGAVTRVAEFDASRAAEMAIGVAAVRGWLAGLERGVRLVPALAFRAPRHA